MKTVCSNCLKDIRYTESDLENGTVWDKEYGEVDCKVLKCLHCRQFNYLYEIKGEIKLKYVK